MKVYKFASDIDRYQALVPTRQQDWSYLLTLFDGTPVNDRWLPITVEPVGDEVSTQELPPSDFPSMTVSHIPVLSKRAVAALEPVLCGNGELLPLRSVQGDYFAFNVTTVVDALDERASEFRRFRDGKIFDIVVHVFRPDELAGLSIFKLPQMHRSHVYVTEGFVQSIQLSQLTGLAPKMVWSSSSP